jgi:D-beta-D-heptose 7-phosphate kinase/D-beta-D-heptose 1-phosphate adenosyltransferase
MINKEKYNKVKILVVGDSCIDNFTYGSVVRLAPEAPVPVFNPTQTTSNNGMAGNVVNNLKSIGVEVFLITNDEVIIKTRYVDERTNQILIRIDENDKISRIDQEILKKIVNNQYNDVTYDSIIISDYDKGFLTEEDIQFICINNKNIFIDTKKILDEWCINADFIKINHVEYEHTKFNINNLDLEKKLIITLSDKGCKYQDKIFTVPKVQIKDVSGAGDTFISGLVAEYVRTKNIEMSIKFAQDCATIVVQKKGVTTI